MLAAKHPQTPNMKRNKKMENELEIWQYIDQLAKDTENLNKRLKQIKRR